MKISKEDKDFLTKNIEKAEALITADDMRGLLDEIDGFMTEKGYGPDDYQELNGIGREAERILDRIYYNN